MLIELNQLRKMLHLCIKGAGNHGKIIDGLKEELDTIKDSYDDLSNFSKKLVTLPYREDWPYVEPDEYDAIKKEWVSNVSKTPVAVVNDISERIEAAFLARVCGCMLGKPVEFNPTLNELKTAGEKCNEWPLTDYISDKLLDNLKQNNYSRGVTAREKLTCAVPDDDINYTVLGMLLIERYGINFTRKNQRHVWTINLSPGLTYGPERTIMAKSTLYDLERYDDSNGEPNWQDWLYRLNPGSELCGALIRVDAYGYACAGNPALAAELAWKDASFTHIKTGVYSSMYIAVAIALAPVEKDLLSVMRKALGYIPQKSRFAIFTKDCLEIVEKASDWMSAYKEINETYGTYTHCEIYQEIGTLINSLHFSSNTNETFCLQVMQGNDTDSFGATAGSIAGLFYGKKGLEEQWLKPLNNTIQIALADFYEQDLTKLAERMGKLPKLIK